MLTFLTGMLTCLRENVSKKSKMLNGSPKVITSTLDLSLLPESSYFLWTSFVHQETWTFLTLFQSSAKAFLLDTRLKSFSNSRKKLNWEENWKKKESISLPAASVLLLRRTKKYIYVWYQSKRKSKIQQLCLNLIFRSYIINASHSEAITVFTLILNAKHLQQLY